MWNSKRYPISYSWKTTLRQLASDDLYDKIRVFRVNTPGLSIERDSSGKVSDRLLGRIKQ